MNSMNVGIEEARKRLGDLITAAQQGTDVTITRNGKPAARITRIQEDAMATYTVEIQAGNDDGTIWQAMHPAENINDNGSAEQVALDVFGNQNLLDDSDGPWRIAVWNGSDADTGLKPAYTLDDQQVRDQQQDAVERWEDARGY